MQTVFTHQPLSFPLIQASVMCKPQWYLNLNINLLSVLNLLLTLSMWPFMSSIIFLALPHFSSNDLGNTVIVEVSQEKTTFIPPACKENCSGCVDWKRTDWSWQKPGLSGCQRSLKLLKEKSPRQSKVLLLPVPSFENLFGSKGNIDRYTSGEKLPLTVKGLQMSWFPASD